MPAESAFMGDTLRALADSVAADTLNTAAEKTNSLLEYGIQAAERSLLLIADVLAQQWWEYVLDYGIAILAPVVTVWAVWYTNRKGYKEFLRKSDAEAVRWEQRRQLEVRERRMARAEEEQRRLVGMREETYLGLAGLRAALLENALQTVKARIEVTYLRALREKGISGARIRHLLDAALQKEHASSLEYLRYRERLSQLLSQLPLCFELSAEMRELIGQLQSLQLCELRPPDFKKLARFVEKDEDTQGVAGPSEAAVRKMLRIWRKAEHVRAERSLQKQAGAPLRALLSLLSEQLQFRWDISAPAEREGESAEYAEGDDFEDIGEDFDENEGDDDAET